MSRYRVWTRCLRPFWFFQDPKPGRPVACLNMPRSFIVLAIRRAVRCVAFCRDALRPKMAGELLAPLTQHQLTDIEVQP